jgi:D-arabinose 1-dehydrogenase-like Zn-dependent alcohol dehydrogenase
MNFHRKQYESCPKEYMPPQPNSSEIASHLWYRTILSPKPGQILVQTEASSVCNTGLHAAHGDWPSKSSLPFIPCHEALGLGAVL